MSEPYSSCSHVLLPGNGSDKKDDKNDKKARLPKKKSEANVKASSTTATNQPRSTWRTQNKTREKRLERNVMNNVGRHHRGHVPDKGAGERL